jgi:HSP20 family protein
MDFKKLVPWNWFNKERDDDRAPHSVPVRRDRAMEPAALGAFGRILQLHREVDRLFDEVFRGFGLGFPANYSAGARLAWAVALRPAVDIQETERQYRISVELPGVEQKDVEMNVADDVLVIRGEKRQQQEHAEGQVHWGERSYGTFQRSLNLPGDADQDSIKATFKGGVLTITIDKQQAVPAARGRSIPITS